MEVNCILYAISSECNIVVENVDLETRSQCYSDYANLLQSRPELSEPKHTRKTRLLRTRIRV